MESNLIRIENFSRFPGGRHRAHGPASGQAFREDVLLPALRENQCIVVDLSAAKVVIPSFMDEAFGPLIASMGKEEFLRRVHVVLRPNSDMKFNFDETVRLRS